MTNTNTHSSLNYKQTQTQNRHVETRHDLYYARRMCVACVDAGMTYIVELNYNMFIHRLKYLSARINGLEQNYSITHTYTQLQPMFSVPPTSSGTHISVYGTMMCVRVRQLHSTSNLLQEQVFVELQFLFNEGSLNYTRLTNCCYRYILQILQILDIDICVISWMTIQNNNYVLTILFSNIGLCD